MTFSRRWTLPALLALAALAPSAPAGAEEATLEGLVREEADEHARLAAWCAEEGLPGEALGEWGDALRLVPDHEKAREGWDAPPARAAKDRARKLAGYEQRRKKLEAEFARRYLALARSLAGAKEDEAAAAAFRRTLDLAPDDADAHKGLGEARVKGVGWFPKAEAEKLNAGLREIDGEWKPKAEVEKERRRWDRAWEVETEHFQVRSNLPWEEVQSLAQAAEALCRAFLGTFAVAWEIPPATERMAVQCFATQAEFQEAVTKVDPRAAASPGFYNVNTATSFFFKRDDYLTTVLHECTHQVMHRLTSSPPDVTVKPQFWLFEGLASWFETYEWQGARPVFLRRPTPKVLGLRKMAASGSPAMPLPAFTALTQEGFQGRPEMYFEALGLVHFLMEGDGGSRRARFLAFSRKVVAGEGSATLFTETFADDGEAALDDWLAFGREGGGGKPGR